MGLQSSDITEQLNTMHVDSFFQPCTFTELTSKQGMGNRESEDTILALREFLVMVSQGLMEAKKGSS